MTTAASVDPSPCKQSSIWFQQLRYLASEAWKHSGVTLVTAVVTVVIFAFPKLTNSLQLDFDSVAEGQWWRLMSGHLTHYGVQHLFWDLLMFVVLGAICERQNRKLFGWVFLSMATGVSLAVMFACTEVSEYRGLSGIDTGLFVWLIIDQLRACLAGRDRYGVAFWGIGGLLLIGKLIFEMVTGDILFVQTDGFKPLVESHLAGAVGGGVAALATIARRSDA